MKFFKKVLVHLFPKIFVVQFLCSLIILILAIKAIPINSCIHSFYWNWKIFIILFIGIIGTLPFIPKVLKIIFHKPRSQNGARWALLFFIFMSLSIPSLIVIDILAVFHFGKVQVINRLEQVQDYPEASFFVMNEPISMNEYRNAFYINDHVSGKSKKTLHIDIYASKVINNLNMPILIGKKYQTDYPGRPTAEFAQTRIDKDLEKARKNFESLNFNHTDTIIRTFEKFANEKYITAGRLLDKTLLDYTIVLEYRSLDISRTQRRSLIIYFGFFLFMELLLILFLTTGKYFKE